MSENGSWFLMKESGSALSHARQRSADVVNIHARDHHARREEHRCVEFKVRHHKQALAACIVQCNHPVVRENALAHDVCGHDVSEQVDDDDAIRPDIQRCDVVPFWRGLSDLACGHFRIALQDLPDDFVQAIAHDGLRERAGCLGSSKEACHLQQVGIAPFVPQAVQAPLRVLLTGGVDLAGIRGGIADGGTDLRLPGWQQKLHQPQVTAAVRAASSPWTCQYCRMTSCWGDWISVAIRPS